MTMRCLPFCNGLVSVAKRSLERSHCLCSSSLRNRGCCLLFHSVSVSLFSRAVRSDRFVKGAFVSIAL